MWRANQSLPAGKRGAGKSCIRLDGACGVHRGDQPSTNLPRVVGQLEKWRHLPRVWSTMIWLSSYPVNRIVEGIRYVRKRSINDCLWRIAGGSLHTAMECVGLSERGVLLQAASGKLR